MPKFYLTHLIILIAVVAGCTPVIPELPADSEILDGPIAGLSAEDNRRHLAGDVAFNDEVFTKESGLGPVFVASSCGSCHAGDGRGHPSTALIRFGQSVPGNNPWMGRGGPQLQQHAVIGYTPEVLPSGVPSSTFLAPAVTGLGFLEAVSDEAILSFVDANDADGDGISGVPNMITHYGAQRIGRFGRKAAAVDLLHQTVNAYNQDMGITSVYFPTDQYTGLEVDPEISTQTINDVVFYLQTLRAPERRNAEDARVKQGEQTFTAIGCVGCHKSSIQTGAMGAPYLKNTVVHPYTDLLLHDMGAELDDGYTEGRAESGEWRTTPLWGLGLSAHSQGGNLFLLHDGRARSIHEAIEYHGGEASGARTRYRALSEDERQALLTFLESL